MSLPRNCSIGYFVRYFKHEYKVLRDTLRIITYYEEGNCIKVYIYEFIM